MRKLNRSDIRNLIESQSQINENPLVPAGASVTVGLSTLGWVALGGIIATLLGGAAWWNSRSNDDQEKIRGAINDLGLHEAFAIYSALKGFGTKTEEVVRQMLGAKTSVELQVDYAKVLVILEDTEDGGLIEWLMDDGMDVEAEELLKRMTRDL
jgi:hypothetical protein